MSDEPETSPRVFLAHHTANKPLARTLAVSLRGRGIDVWFDEWEIEGGDNFVECMEKGISSAHGGLLLCTSTGLDGSWAREEYGALLQRVIEGKERSRPFLIPVTAGPDPVVPTFLRPRRKVDHEDLEGIILAILVALGMSDGGKPSLGPLIDPSTHRVLARAAGAADLAEPVIVRVASMLQRGDTDRRRLEGAWHRCVPSHTLPPGDAGGDEQDLVRALVHDLASRALCAGEGDRGYLERFEEALAPAPPDSVAAPADGGAPSPTVSGGDRVRVIIDEVEGDEGTFKVVAWKIIEGNADRIDELPERWAQECLEEMLYKLSLRFEGPMDTRFERLEFVVDTLTRDWRFETWQIDNGTGRGKTSICTPIVLRELARARPGFRAVVEKRRAHWAQGRAVGLGQGGPNCCAPAQCLDASANMMSRLQDSHAVCVGLPQLADRGEHRTRRLVCVLRLGIPVAVWTRSGCSADAALESFLGTHPIRDLPSAVYRQRRDEGPLGGHLAILYDDPDDPIPTDQLEPPSTGATP